MNKRKAAHIISFLCITFAAILCVTLFRSPISSPGRIYYDDNLLFKEDDHFHAIKSIGTPINENSDGSFSFGRFSGSRTVKAINLNEDENISYTWDVNVENGKFKIVLVNLENAKVTQTICEGSGSGSEKIHSLPAGEYRVKFVGDSATVEGMFGIRTD